MDLTELDRDSEKHKIIEIRDGNGDIAYKVTSSNDGLVDVRPLQACAKLASMRVWETQRKEQMRWLSPWMRIALAYVATLVLAMFVALIA